MIVRIKPIESLLAWHKKSLNEYPPPAKVIRAFVDVNTYQYKTGLTEEEIQEYSQKLGVDLSVNFNIDKPSEFWDGKQGSLSLTASTVSLDTTIPLQFIKYKIALASDFVASSKKAYDEGLYPKATHYIVNETQEIEAKATKVAKKKYCNDNIAKLSRSEKVNLLLLLTDTNYKTKSDSFITVAIDELVETKYEELGYLLKLDNKEYISTKALVLECLQNSILTKKGHKIMYFDSEIGVGIEETVKYLNQPINQSLKIQLIDKVKKD